MCKWKYFAGAILSAVIFLSGCHQPPAIITDSVQSADGSRLEYDVGGSGDTAIVFVHCWTCNRTFWNEQFGFFAKNYQVVRLDLAGHGQSDASQRNYTMVAFAADVAAVVNKLKLQRIVLVGHSMGGPVAVEASKLLGERVLGVVGVDTFYTAFPLPQNDEQAAAFVKPFEDDFLATSRGMVNSMFLPSADSKKKSDIMQTVLAANQKMAVSALKDIVRWYRFDAASSLAALGKRLYNINADPGGTATATQPRVVLVANVGHFVPQIKPQAFNQALDGIVKKLSVVKK